MMVDPSVINRLAYDIHYSLHITFADGSNPYVRFGMTADQFRDELNRWEKNYILTEDEEVNGIIYVTARERNRRNGDEEKFAE